MFRALENRESAISREEQIAFLNEEVTKLIGDAKRVLLIPPDHTRLHSETGFLSAEIYRRFHKKVDIKLLPALGTHEAMTEAQLRMMFGEDIPLSAFIDHHWRNKTIHLGEVPGDYLRDLTGGRLSYSMQVEVNEELFKDYDLVLSLGQVVPHEVIGMANYTKNICIGVGGKDMIDKSHFLGAVHGMEKIMGRAHNPVRSVLNKAFFDYVAPKANVHFLLTVISSTENGDMGMNGLYLGQYDDVFEAAVSMSQECNLNFLERSLKKVVVHLDPREFHSTWLGNKSIYRTRMAIETGGELIVLAPALNTFGEDKEIDRLIRKFGYKGTKNTLEKTESEKELADSLSAAAHLIHGSSEDRFQVTYCPGHLSQSEIESVGFQYADLGDMSKKYNPEKLEEGYNIVDGEEIYYIAQPGLGLWADRGRFK